MKGVAVAVLLCAVLVVQAFSSILPPPSVACAPLNSSSSGNRTVPPIGLSWCKFYNPFILSDFLSRNSTDLTVKRDGQKYNLKYKCERKGGSKHRQCTAINQIRTGSMGRENETQRYVIYSDIDGNMLFVNFNNNTMANSVQITINNVTKFDVSQFSSSHEQHMILLIGNRSTLAVQLIRMNSTVSSPCLLASIGNYSWIEQHKVELIFAEFWPPPQSRNKTTGLVNLAWVFQQYDQDSGLYLQYITSVPANESTAVEYVEQCKTLYHTPLGLELGIQLQSQNPLQFVLHYNQATNMSFFVAYSEIAVAVFRLEYNGTASYAINTTFIFQNIPLMGEWCSPTVVFNKTSGESKVWNRLPSTIYCVPNNSTRVTSVSTFSPDHFKGIGDWRKDVYIAIALKNETAAYIHMMDLMELTFVDSDQSTLENPLGLPPSFGTTQFPCDFDTEAFDPRSGECMQRYIVEYTFELNEEIARMVVYGVQLNPNSTGTGVEGSSAHGTVFVAQGRRITVFSLHGPLTENPNPEHPVALDLANEIDFLGDVQFFQSSINTQHLFVAVSRGDWEIESQQRYLEICQALDRNPKDPFLQPYLSRCSSFPPQEVNLNTFAQYTSYCTSNVYCPSLDELVVEWPEPGFYADRPAVKKECPQGSFCVLGSKQPCPPGFYCPEKGMTLPLRCPTDENFSTTCAEYGNVAPTSCLEGTACIVTHFPGIPAPPGKMMPALPTLRTDFELCPAGWWCALGAFNGSTVDNSPFQCPANTFCPSTAVLEPTACQCVNGSIANGTGSDTIPCDSRTMFCPPGTTNVSWCPAGKYCTTPDKIQSCVPTQYCPQGTFAPQICPAGMYCPDPSVALQCPHGYYCSRGSVTPSECNFLTVCPAGSESESRSFFAPAILVLIVIGVLVTFAAFTRIQQKQNESARHVAPKTAVPALNNESDAESLESSALLVSSRGTIPTSNFKTPTIEFVNMGLTLQVGEAKGKRVLDDVSGQIVPGSFIAVMGPSGSGKSTFMHTLAGKAFYGQRSGTVLINGDEVDLTEFSKVVGFVKQDDIMLREMTVAETILFNSKMRYDPSVAVDSPEGICNAILCALDLNHVRDINIGDEKKRGISGGQRKRVNIGMEMAALPCILFLDEPTSGLDSSSSMSVCASLRDMAVGGGITVIAVIHQPRNEIFQMFHQVMLLGAGGKLVYFGEPGAALTYFEKTLGVACPPHVNPPDFFLDTISGDAGSALTVEEMAFRWKEFSAKRREGDLSNEATSPLQQFERGTELARQAATKKVAPFHKQVLFFTTRSLTQLSRDLAWFFADLALVLISGFFLGLVFSQSAYHPPLPKQIIDKSLSAFAGTAPPELETFLNEPIDDPIISEASLTCMAIGMTGVTAALRVFGPEQIVYWREASAGMSGLAYFIAKNVTHLLFIVLSPLLYLAPFLTFVSARASFLAYYRVVVVTQFATTGLGYLISMVAPPSLAQLGGVVAVLVCAMFGGCRPTLVEIQQMFYLLQIIPYVSYIRWAQEALYIEEISMWVGIPSVNINPSLKLFDYSLDEYAMCMWLTIAFGVAFRVAAFLAMILMNREQKQ